MSLSACADRTELIAQDNKACEDHGLKSVLDHPDLNRILGVPQNSRVKVGPKKPPAR